MDEDVVLVAVQYRLGPLGFLSLQNEDIKVQFITVAPLESIHCTKR
jgi:carboxylesterase type B